MSKLPSVNVTLSGTQLSDLFFNSDHLVYESLFRKDTKRKAFGKDDFKKAILDDAQIFMSYLGIQADVTARQYDWKIMPGCEC